MPRDIRAVFDASGLPQGFYDAAIDDPARIPAGAVAISDDDWIALRGGGKRWEGSGVADAPPAPAPPTAPRQRTGRSLRYALNAQGWRAAWDRAVAGRAAAGKPDDADYWTTLGSGDTAPETNPKLARIAAAANPPVDLKALYDAAPPG